MNNHFKYILIFKYYDKKYNKLKGCFHISMYPNISGKSVTSSELKLDLTVSYWVTGYNDYSGNVVLTQKLISIKVWQ